MIFFQIQLCKRFFDFGYLKLLLVAVNGLDGKLVSVVGEGERSGEPVSLMILHQQTARVLGVGVQVGEGDVYELSTCFHPVGRLLY